MPLSDIPTYAMRFLSNRLHQRRNREKRLAYWGPRIRSVERLAVDHSLVEICATQWAETVDASEKAFAAIPADRFIKLKYETFVHIRNKRCGASLPFSVTKRLPRTSSAVSPMCETAPPANGGAMCPRGNRTPSCASPRKCCSIWVTKMHGDEQATLAGPPPVAAALKHVFDVLISLIGLAATWWLIASLSSSPVAILVSAGCSGKSASDSTGANSISSRSGQCARSPRSTPR